MIDIVSGCGQRSNTQNIETTITIKSDFKSNGKESLSLLALVNDIDNPIKKILLPAKYFIYISKLNNEAYPSAFHRMFKSCLKVEYYILRKRENLAHLLLLKEIFNED